MAAELDIIARLRNEASQGLGQLKGDFKGMGDAADKSGLQMAAVKQQSQLLEAKMNELGRAVAKGEKSFEDAERELKDYKKGLADLGDASNQAEQSTKQLSKGFSAMDVALGNLIADGLARAGEAVVEFIGDSIDLASNAAETTSLLENSLGPAAVGFSQDMDRMAEATNRSAIELEAGASTIVAMTRSMGMGQQAAADFSAQMAQIAVDLGSFFNQSTEQVFHDIQGALAGSTETMQKYGIDVRETSLQQAAFEMGLIGVGEKLDRVTRAQVIQAEIMRQASDAMGDAERTAGSYGNTQRGLEAAMLDLQVVVGEALIPALTELATVTIPAVRQAAEDLGPALTDMGEKAAKLVKDAADNLHWNALKEQLKEAGVGYKELGQILGPAKVGFDEFAAGLFNVDIRMGILRKESDLMEIAIRALSLGFEAGSAEFVDFVLAQNAATERAEAMNEALGATDVTLADLTITSNKYTDAGEEVVEVSEEEAAAFEEMELRADLALRALQRLDTESGAYEVTADQVAQAEKDRAAAHDAAAEAADEAAAAVDALAASLQANFLAALNSSEGIGFYNESMEELGDHTAFVSNLTNEQASDLDKLQDAYDKAADKLHDYELGLDGTGLSQEELSAKMGEQQAIMGELGPQIELLNSVGGEYVSWTTEATINTDKVNQAIFDAVAATDIGAAGVAIMGGALGLYSEEAVAAALKSALISEKIAELAGTFDGTAASATNIQEQVMGFIESLEGIGPAADAAATASDSATTALSAQDEALAEKLGIFDEAATTASGSATTAFGEIETAATTHMGAAATTVDEKAAAILTTVQEAFGEMATTADAQLLAMTTSAETNMTATTAVVETGMGEVVAAVGTGWTDAVTTSAGYVPQFEGVGLSIAGGMTAGVLAGEGALAAAVAGIVTAALAAGAAAAEASSPSEKAKRDIGLPIPQGIAEGVLAGEKEVADAVGTVVTNAITAVSGGRLGEGGTFAEALYNGMIAAGVQTMLSQSQFASLLGQATGAAPGGFNPNTQVNFAAGGFTGTGQGIAGAVHRNEYVFDPISTRNIGAENLAALQAAGQSGPVSPMGGNFYFSPSISVSVQGGSAADVNTIRRIVREELTTVARDAQNRWRTR